MLVILQQNLLLQVKYSLICYQMRVFIVIMMLLTMKNCFHILYRMVK